MAFVSRPASRALTAAIFLLAGACGRSVDDSAQLPESLPAGSVESLFLLSEGPTKQLLGQLEKRNQGALGFRVDGAGVLRFLAADTIAPSCEAPARLTKAAAERVVACVVEALAPPLRIEEHEDAPAFRIRSIDPADDGITVITLDQMLGDLRVYGSESLLTLHRGIPGQYSGGLRGARAWPLPAEPPKLDDPKRVLARAEKAADRKLTAPERYYDPAVGGPVTVFELAETGGFVWFDELRGEILRTDNAARPYTPRSQSTIHHRFDDRFGEPGPGTASHSIGVDVDDDTFGSGCDRKADHRSHGENMEPKVVWDDDNDGNGSTFSLRGSGATCQSGADYITETDTNHHRFAVSTTYWWMHDMALFTKSQQAAYKDWYDWHDENSENLKVVVSKEADRCEQEDGSEPDACAVYGRTEYRIILDLREGTYERLGTMAHEQGHVLHFMYGFHAGSGLLPRSVEEGFAQHNPFRYALYRWRTDGSRPHDVFTGLGYEDVPIVVHPWHGWKDGTGEYLPNALGAYVEGQLIHRPDSDVCGGDTAPDPHICGDTIPIVYWELAWNQLRVPYRGRWIGDPILYWSNYASTPERPANVAFTHAIRSISDDATVRDFFAAVSYRYRKFRDEGSIGSRISPDEYDRVHAVLNHHCVGWSHHCDDYHRLPGSPLPVVYTRKTFFSRERSRLLLTAPGDVELAGGASAVGFGTPDGVEFARLDGEGESVHFDTYLQAGRYRFDLAYRAGSGADVELRVGAAEGCRWRLPGSAGFAWAKGEEGCALRDVGRGTATIEIAAVGDVDIEAIRIERLSLASGGGGGGGGGGCGGAQAGQNMAWLALVAWVSRGLRGRRRRRVR